jgi:DUF177 domain-containing protein
MPGHSTLSRLAFPTMLRLDLTRLDREGSLQIEARIPPDDPLWVDTQVAFAGPVEFSARATRTGSGEILVRGTLDAPLDQECRRCLEPVPGELSEEVTWVFLPATEPGMEDDGDTRLFDEAAAELDLSNVLREEVILAVDPYVVCRPDCKGLCPKCGVNLNVHTCNCTEEEPDPRWDALRALKEE